MKIARRPHLPSALLLVVGVCCAPNHGEAFERSLAEGERAESAGRFVDAAARYDEAARRALIARDRDHAQYLAAVMLAQGGDVAGASLRLQAIADAVPPREDSAAAAYKRAELRLGSGPAGGNDEGGWAEMEAMLRRFPNDGLAAVAFHRLIRHTDEVKGDRGTLDWLRALAPALQESERAEEIAYEVARRLARVGEDRAARDAFVQVAVRWPYPKGALFDDALWRASEIDEKLGRYDEAIGDLTKMLEVRETSYTIGSYERPRFPDAQMRIALLYRDRLHDRVRARDALETLYAKFTASVLRDRALWLEAELWREDKDDTAACRALAKLVHEFPDSRYVQCAIERCPTLLRSPDSKAAKTCHSYIEHALEQPSFD